MVNGIYNIVLYIDIFGVELVFTGLYLDFDGEYVFMGDSNNPSGDNGESSGSSNPTPGGGGPSGPHGIMPDESSTNEDTNEGTTGEGSSGEGNSEGITGENSNENNSNQGNTFSTNADDPAECEHRSRNRTTVADDESFRENPVPCTFCGTPALNGTPFQQAIVCDNCGSTICENCNDPNSDSDKDSGIGEE